MSHRENVSYLVPRDPSIKCWDDRVKLPEPCTKNLIQMGSEEFEETMGGNIKVYLRLKPSLSSDNPYTVLSPSMLQSEAPKESVCFRNATNGVGKLIHKFTFTSILDQDISQAELFKICAVKNLKKFLSGKNYLLMAYGTTSAGKTFTMQGNVENPGVIPRALEFVFTALKGSIIPMCRYTPYQYNEFLVLSRDQLKKDVLRKNCILSLDLSKCQRYPGGSTCSDFSDSYENVTFKEMQSNLTETESFEFDPESFKYSVWISMIEIYNEQVYDLLELPNSKGEKPKLKFREDECGNTFVSNLSYVNVCSGHEAFQILQFGRSNLHLAPTALNNKSSRSHCIFTITVAKFLDYDLSSEAIISRFSFCDLAGIERAKKTLNVKDRLVESKAINTSLSILAKCLTTIKENQSSRDKKMIPYRESKLTKLFRDAFMGKEHFSIIVNVTTEPNLFDETLNVLKFSAIAQKIVTENMFAKPKAVKVSKRSRFSRIVINSSCKKNIDWETATMDATKLKDDISDSGVEDRQDLVEFLKDELEKERKRCEEIECKIREELTSKFSEILKKLNENHELRLENESERLEEMYKNKEKRIIHYYEMLRQKKRPRLEEEVSDSEDQDEKLKEVIEEMEKLKNENLTLKQTLREMMTKSSKLHSECSELRFKLIEKDRCLEALQRANEAHDAGADELSKELFKQLDEANAKVTDFKTLLNEAASDYKEIEESNKFLRDENEVLHQELTNFREMVADLRNENIELEKILSQHRILVEKLEDANEKMRERKKEEEEEEKKKKKTNEEENLPKESKLLESLQNQMKNRDGLGEQSYEEVMEKLKASKEECQLLKREKSDCEKDLEIANLKIADLQSKILNLENDEREKELLKRIDQLDEDVIRLQEFRTQAENLSKENQMLNEKCKELEGEVKTFQKELKDLISSSKMEREKLMELETLTESHDKIRKELVALEKKNSALEEELKEQTEKFKAAERESQIALESLRGKFETVKYQNTVMKSLKDEAERQAYEVPQLHDEIKRLEKELENREKDMLSFNENRKLIFNNYEKELTRLKEENERLRKDVLFANEVIAKSMTPLKTDKAEINRLKESVKKKDEEIYKLKGEIEASKKAEAQENNVKLEETSSRENSPFVSLKKKKGAGREPAAEVITKQIQNLSLQQPELRSARKKVDLLEETIHPSTIKNANKGRRKKEEKKEKKEKTGEAEKAMESEKENLETRKNKNKCYRKLFIENEFDGYVDLNVSPLEEISRLRPRK